MMKRHLGRTALLLLLLTATPATVLAQSDPVRAEARERFDRGIRLFNEGDNAGSLAEFKRVYELAPNALTLYNIGLVYAAMNRPVESVDALSRVLSDAGALTGDKLARAERTRDEQQRRIARLDVKTSEPALIELDGVTFGQTPHEGPFLIPSGVHVVGAVAKGFVPVRKEVTIAGGQTGEVRFDLVAMEGVAAQIRVVTPLPSADIVVDAQVVGRSPLAQSISVAPGSHVVELRRLGYRTTQQTVVLGDGASTSVSFDPEEDRAAVDAAGSALSLHLSESQVEVTVDGKRRGVYEHGFALAPGVHRIRLERGGFQPADRDVDLAAGHTTLVEIVLEPTPDTRVAYVSRTTTQKTWGIILTVAGVAITGTGTGLIIWNEPQWASAKSEFDRLNGALINKTTPCNTPIDDFAKCNAMVAAAATALNDANARRAVSFITLGVGVATTITGVVLLLTNGDPHRYDPKAAGIRWIAPTWTDGGAGFALGGAF